MEPQSSNHGLAIAALGGTALFVAALLALHALQPELSPMNEAMSYYVHGAHGWLLTTALLAVGAGSLAHTVGLARVLRGRTARLGIVFLMVWSVGAILGGAFAADPRGKWDQPPSVSGAIHGISAIVALTAFPPAALMIAGGWRRDPANPPAAGLITLLAFASVCSFIAFATSLVPVMFRPGPPVLLGLTQRIMLGFYAAWLCATAVGLLQFRRSPAE